MGRQIFEYVCFSVRRVYRLFWPVKCWSWESSLSLFIYCVYLFESMRLRNIYVYIYIYFDECWMVAWNTISAGFCTRRCFGGPQPQIKTRTQHVALFWCFERDCFIGRNIEYIHISIYIYLYTRFVVGARKCIWIVWDSNDKSSALLFRIFIGGQDI